jgi:hypothetical protein
MRVRMREKLTSKKLCIIISMFPDNFKSVVKSNLEGSIAWLLEEYPEIKQRLNIPVELFSVDEELEKLPEFNEFVAQNRVLIRNKYNLLVRPRLQIIEDAEQDVEKYLLSHFIEDFFQYAVYKCVEADNVDESFEESWKFFEVEFFADENKFEFQARLKNVYYHGGIGLDNVIPWDDVDLFSARSPLDYRMLGWERKGGRHYEFMDFFQPPWMILRKKAVIGGSKHILSACKETEDQFNLFTFVVRNISKGDAYFNDIRFFGLGHFSPHSILGVSWSPIRDNDIYEEFGEYTTIEHPWDWSISKVLSKCNPSSYKDFVFADWHIRLNGKFKFPFDQEYTQTRKQYFFYEQILNLSFVFNSLLPDLKDRNGYPNPKKNKELREDYLPEVLTAYGGIDKNYAISTIKIVYDIRNKIAHGKPQEASSALGLIGTEENIKNKINFFQYIVSRIILISLANPDFKSKMETFHVIGSIQTTPTLINPFS